MVRVTDLRFELSNLQTQHDQFTLQASAGLLAMFGSAGLSHAATESHQAVGIDLIRKHTLLSQRGSSGFFSADATVDLAKCFGQIVEIVLDQILLNDGCLGVARAEILSQLVDAILCRDNSLVDFVKAFFQSTKFVDLGVLGHEDGLFQIRVFHGVQDQSEVSRGC
jgi:hypothetical protein